MPSRSRLSAVLRATAVRLSRRYLVMLARRLVVTKPIRKVPGWWSGHAFAAPSPERELRMRLCAALRGERVAVRWYDGLQLELRVGNDISRLIFGGGELDPNEFAFLAAFVRRGMCAVDVGANEGLYTLFLRQHVGNDGRVIAIEPSERERAHLRRNLGRNGFTDVEILSVAVADHSGRAALSVAEHDHAGHNALGPPAAAWVRVAGTQDVPVETLDALAHRHRWPKVDLIKMDIEGMEFAALRGAEALLQRDRPLILFEAEDESAALRGESLGAMLRWLRKRGYVIMDFSGADGSPAAIGDRGPKTLNLLALSLAVHGAVAAGTAVTHRP
jgi:FkbM family methyltransferase